MKKKILLTAAVTAMLVSGVSAAASGEITVSFDGKNIAFDNPPQLINDRVMVPVRKIFETLGAEVTYDAETKTATAIKDAHYAQLTDGSIYMALGVCRGGTDDGELSYATSGTLDSEPVIVNNTMYVPARAVSEAFYYDVEWDADKEQVKITTPTDADGWIYYASWNDKGHIYKIDTNGQHRQMIADGDCYLDGIYGIDGNFIYNDDYLYYSIREPETPDEEGKLYRIKTDGTAKEQLTEQPIIRMYGVSNDDEEICFLEPVDGKNGGYRYSGNREMYIVKVDWETGEVKRLLEEPVRYAEEYKDYIYFRYSGEDIESCCCYRMDKNGENIINVTGDIPVSYIHIDKDKERIRFSSIISLKDYTAALDGSDLKEDEETKSPKDKYGFKDYSYAYGYDETGNLKRLIAGKKEDGLVYCYNDEDGEEIFKIQMPEDVSLYEINVDIANGRIFYDIHNGEYEDEILYVDSIDEIMGMEYISVGAEKVDGKYAISLLYGFGTYVPAEEDGIYSINFDGSDNKRILDGGYRVGYIKDGQLIVYDKGYDRYTVDFDGNNLEKYVYKNPNSDVKAVALNEVAKYGIVVKNDGTVEPYRGGVIERWW